MKNREQRLDVTVNLRSVQEPGLHWLEMLETNSHCLHGATRLRVHPYRRSSREGQISPEIAEIIDELRSLVEHVEIL